MLVTSLETRIEDLEIFAAKLIEENDSLEIQLVEQAAKLEAMGAKAVAHPQSLGILLRDGLAEVQRAEQAEQARAQAEAGSGKRARNPLQNPFSNESQAIRSAKRAKTGMAGQADRSPNRPRCNKFAECGSGWQWCKGSVDHPGPCAC